MEFEDKPAQEIDLQTVPMDHIETGICNIPESSNTKQDPELHRNDDAVKFSEHVKFGGNVANIIDIKNEVMGSDDYQSENLNNVYGPTHSDSNVGNQMPATNVTAIKPAPRIETHINTECVIEMDTCKDKYYEQYVYPTNCVNANLQFPQRRGGRTLCIIDTRPCIVRLRDIRNTYPHIIKQRSVQIHEPVTDVTKHTKSIKINKTHVCPVCELAFPNNSKLNIHTLTHTEVKPYKCSVCGVGFKQKGHRNKHTRIHTGEKPHKCPVCKVGFTDKAHLTRHMRIHTGEKPYKCSVCGVEFAHKGNLKTHKLLHTGEKPHKCSVCGVGFTQKGNLTDHIQTHTGEKPYKCSVCRVAFGRKSDVTRHTRIHTGEKPHTCSVCEVSFREKGNLTQHMQTHTGEKPYTCPVCGVGFAHQGRLAKHTQMHTDEKTHKCSVCGVSYTRKCHLARHMGIHKDLEILHKSDQGLSISHALDHTYSRHGNLGTYDHTYSVNVPTPHE